MNIIKWLADKAGKITPLQMAGLGLGVVAAGAVAVNVLAPSNNNNTSFNLDQFDDRGEVAYVANSGGGSYTGAPSASGNGGGMTGNEASSVRLSARTLHALSAADSRETAANEMIANDQEAFGKGYDMTGDTTGLGLMGNVASEKNPDAMAQLGKAAPNGLADMSGMMAGMKGAMAGVQGGGAEGGAQGAEGGAAGAGAPPQLAAASKDWSSSAAKGGGHGNAFGGSYSKMDSGKNRKAGGDVLAQAGEAMGNVQQAITSANERVARMKNNSKFGRGDGLSANAFDSSGSGFKNSKQGKDLEYIKQHTFKTAATNTRSTVDAMGGFLSSDKVSGGVSLTGNTFASGKGHSSSDFNSLNENSLMGLNQAFGAESDMMTEVEKEVEARKKLDIAIWIALPLALTCMVLTALFATAAYMLLPGLPWTGAAVAFCFGMAAMFSAIGLAPVIAMMAIAGELAGEYGSSNLTNFSFGIGGALIAAMGLAWIPGVGKFLGPKLAFAAAMVLAPLLGIAGAAWMTGMEGPTETVEMTPEELEEYYKNKNNE